MAVPDRVEIPEPASAPEGHQDPRELPQRAGAGRRSPAGWRAPPGGELSIQPLPLPALPERAAQSTVQSAAQPVAPPAVQRLQLAQAAVEPAMHGFAKSPSQPSLQPSAQPAAQQFAQHSAGAPRAPPHVDTSRVEDAATLRSPVAASALSQTGRAPPLAHPPPSFAATGPGSQGAPSSAVAAAARADALSPTGRGPALAHPPPTSLVRLAGTANAPQSVPPSAVEAARGAAAESSGSSVLAPQPAAPAGPRLTDSVGVTSTQRRAARAAAEEAERAAAPAASLLPTLR